MGTSPPDVRATSSYCSKFLSVSPSDAGDAGIVDLVIRVRCVELIKKITKFRNRQARKRITTER